jgi:hypothetical protein
MPLEPETAKKRRPPTRIKSANKFFFRSPEKYRAIVKMLGNGNAPIHVKRTMHVSQLTVQIIMEREAEVIAEFRKEYLRKARLLSKSLVEDIEARLPQMKVKELILAYSVLADQIHDLESEAAIESQRAGAPTL